jgi:uncharacterized protein
VKEVEGPNEDTTGTPALDYLRGENRCPYRWATGDVVGVFLASLRDHRKILGGVCGQCGMVIVPPRSYCESCSGEVEELREVGPRGIIMSWARATNPPPGLSIDVPFRYILVRLAGADTELLHLAPDEEGIRIGAAVSPEFAEERSGNITDIRWFVPEGEKRGQSTEPVAGREDVEPVIEVSGELDLEFKYSYGEHYDRFYREMRDNRRIMGIRCSRCNGVLLPPRPYCGHCYAPADEWVELSDEGTVLTYTEVHLPFRGQPTDPPYIYAFIMLGGADVQFPHLLGEVEADEVEVGMKVKAVWSDDRRGTLHDIRYFRPVE